MVEAWAVLCPKASFAKKIKKLQVECLQCPTDGVEIAHLFLAAQTQYNDTETVLIKLLLGLLDLVSFCLSLTS